MAPTTNAPKVAASSAASTLIEQHDGLKRVGSRHHDDDARHGEGDARFTQPRPRRARQQPDSECADERRQRKLHSRIVQGETKLVAHERQTADGEHRAVGAVIEDRETAPAGKACECTKPQHRQLIELRWRRRRDVQVCGGGDEAEPKARGGQHHQRVGETGDAGDNLVLHQVEQAGNQRKARHQEKCG